MRRAITSLALALAALVAGPTAPSAADTDVQAEFTTRGSHGFIVEWGSNAGGPAVLVIRDRHHANFYSAREAETSASGVEARFGRLGEFALEFEPTKTKSTGPPSGCRGEPELREEGFFVGSAHFRGERGFTTIDADRVAGRLDVSPEWQCPRHPGVALPGRSRKRRAANASDQGYLRARGPAGEAFLANSGALPSGRTTFSFVGAMRERREGMFIAREGFFAQRSASAAVAAARFEFDHAAGTAAVDPPYPFRGEARFRRGPSGAGSWRGDLAVSLLGQAPIRVAGPGFHARLFRRSPESPD